MASALPDYEAKTIGPMVEDMAQRLRLGRAAQRLRSTVVEQAQTIRAARLGVPVGVGGTSEDEATDAVEDLGSATEEFEQTIQRQRELTRAYQRATGRRSASDDDPGERELA